MAMLKFTVDTTAKLFIAKPGVTAVDVQIDLYSDAKEHWLSGGVAMGFKFPIRTVAGDPITPTQNVAPYFFLGDGWKIRPDEADHTLTATGNLFLDEGETGGIFVPTLGDFTVLINIVTSPQALGIEGLPSAIEIRDAILSDSTPFPGANIDAAISSRAAVGAAMALTGAERLAVADTLLSRDMSYVEATVAIQSLCSMILKLTSRFNSQTGKTYRSDGTTPHMTQIPVIDVNAKPIVELGKGS
jgi:hypothetical protein